MFIQITFQEAKMARFKGNQHCLLVNDETWILVSGIDVTDLPLMASLDSVQTTKLISACGDDEMKKVSTQIQKK